MPVYEVAFVRKTEKQDKTMQVYIEQQRSRWSNEFQTSQSKETATKNQIHTQTHRVGMFETYP